MAPRKKFRRRDNPFPRLSRESDFSVTCYRDARHLSRGVGERNAAANRAPVSNLVMCNMTYRFRQQRLGPPTNPDVFSISHHPHPRAESHILGANFNSVEARHIFQVNEKPGAARRNARMGMRLCPPASTMASSSSLRRVTASARLAGQAYSKGGNFINTGSMFKLNF